MFEVRFDEEVLDFLSTLPLDTRKRIFNKITSTKENPFHFFERLVGREDYKLRVGDYRIVAEINEAQKVIHITIVGHRKNIYKNI